MRGVDSMIRLARYLMAGLLMSLLLIAGLSRAAIGSPRLGEWQEMTGMPGAKHIHRNLVVNGRLYSIAGGFESVFHTGIKDDGSLETWRATTPLPVNYPAVAARGGRIYVVSGTRNDIKQNNSVYYGDVAADGSIAEWKEGRFLPEEALHGGEALLAGNYLYYIGGWHCRDIYRAPVLQNLNLGEWEKINSLPTTRFYMGTAVFENSLYIFGGMRIWMNFLDSSIMASLDADGLPGNWQRTTALPEAISSFAFAQDNRDVFVIGGNCGTVFSDRTYMTQIAEDGHLADWQTMSALPYKVSYAAAVAYKGYVYVTGGWTEAPDGRRDLTNKVFAARINQ